MRLVSRVIASFASALLILGAFGVFQTPSVAAQTAPAPAQNPTAGYDDIVGTGSSRSVGLIFANICSGPRPVAGQPGGEACACRDEGRCSLDNVMQVFVNITVLILGVSGSVVLLMFVYGGFVWVTSRGDAKAIERGKDTINHAFIGFAIIILSYSLINFLIASLAGDAPSATIEQTVKNAQDKNADLDLDTSTPQP